MAAYSEEGNELEERRKFLSSVLYGGLCFQDNSESRDHNLLNVLKYVCPVSGL